MTLNSAESDGTKNWFWLHSFLLKAKRDYVVWYAIPMRNNTDEYWRDKFNCQA